MALYEVPNAHNNIKIGDLITSLHAGCWVVNNIEKRTHEKDGSEINSLIHYELAFDSNFKPTGKNKRKNACDSYYCKKIDDSFFQEKLEELNSRVDALCNFALAAKAMNYLSKFPINLMSMGGWHSSFAAHKVGQWLDVGGTTRTNPDATHSALLQRLFSGKDPLPKPPPLRMSSPWYELGEGNKIELDLEFDKIRVINQTVYIGDSSPFLFVNRQASPNLLVYPPSGEVFNISFKDKKMFIQKTDFKENEAPFKPFEIDGKWTGCDGCGSVDCDGSCR